jgi:hypothetical protein
VHGSGVRQNRLDVADVHRDGYATGAFSRAFLAELNQALARQVLPAHLAQFLVESIERERFGTPRRFARFTHVLKVEFDKMAECFVS